MKEADFTYVIEEACWLKPHTIHREEGNNIVREVHIEFWSLNHIKDHEVGREKKAKHRSLQDAISYSKFD